jgi:glycerol-3-phosphate dehydrogenase (NAD(P)+)
MRVTVIGAGSWGSAIACLLGNAGHEVQLWARDAELAATINNTRHNPRYLSDIVFPQTVQATASLKNSVEKTESLVLVTPSSALPQMADHLASLGVATLPLVLLSKGIERTGGHLLLEVLAERLGAHSGEAATQGAAEHLAVLSGPNHAEEVARNIPSATVVASLSEQTARFFQALFSTPAFRVYTSTDVVGVQLCAAAKNIIAIACGLASGLGMGDNTLALLMTRGLAEISRLVASQGGEQLTCMGLAGMGDLVATCTSPHSRNRGFGLELASGKTLEAYQQRTHMVVEGAAASLSITDLARKQGIELPISEALRSIIWESAPLKKTLLSLLDRSPKAEFY